VTVIAESVLAYTSSLGGIALLGYLSARNRAAGWRRQRHPNCFERPAMEAVTDESGIRGRDESLVNSGTARQLVALSQSVISEPRQDDHDQNCECPAAASTSRT
jgi:hypothetical protein